MAKGSHTQWADYIQRPPTCAICGQRVTLKQSFRQHFDELRQHGEVIHTRCEENQMRDDDERPWRYARHTPPPSPAPPPVKGATMTEPAPTPDPPLEPEQPVEPTTPDEEQEKLPDDEEEADE